ncbi:MAG: hypothetical protein WD055_02595 [Candidatus Dependentiae bacterium]
MLPSSVKPAYWLETDATKRRSSYPFLSGDTFRDFADHIFDETRKAFDSNDIKYGDIIFVNGDYIHYFLMYVHPEIPVGYILITHNTLFAPPGKYKNYLEGEKIIAWFAKNIQIKNHPKLHGIPLGLANRYWPHGNIEVLYSVINKEIRKDKLLYLNILSNTHDSRLGIIEMFKDKPYCFVANKKPFDGYMQDIARSKFVLSPRGAGLDCHRTWEAILVGSIPIVPQSVITGLYEKLPILVIDDWSILTEDYLNRKWDEMHQVDYDYDRMFAQYWFGKIKMCQSEARESYKKGLK